MHYFPSWTEEGIMAMSYESFIMYLNTIPEMETDDEPDADGKPKPKNEKVGSFNLFDLEHIKK